MTVDGNDMDFFYDANGAPYALKYMGTTYYYITNLQDDVVSIVDETGLTIALYEYDAWGNILKEWGSIGLLNPLFITPRQAFASMEAVKNVFTN